MLIFRGDDDCSMAVLYCSSERNFRCVFGFVCFNSHFALTTRLQKRSNTELATVNEAMQLLKKEQAKNFLS